MWGSKKGLNARSWDSKSSFVTLRDFEIKFWTFQVLHEIDEKVKNLNLKKNKKATTGKLENNPGESLEIQG